MQSLTTRWAIGWLLAVGMLAGGRANPHPPPHPTSSEKGEET
jgi:hypothetical protein